MVKHTQTICRLLPTNYLSVFDHFVRFVLQGLSPTFSVAVGRVFNFNKKLDSISRVPVRFRSSYQICSTRKGALRNFAKFTEKQLCQSHFFNNFIKKETLAQVFSCEFCKYSKNIFFTEHLWATALEIWKILKGTFRQCISRPLILWFPLITFIVLFQLFSCGFWTYFCIFHHRCNVIFGSVFGSSGSVCWRSHTRALLFYP